MKKPVDPPSRLLSPTPSPQPKQKAKSQVLEVVELACKHPAEDQEEKGEQEEQPEWRHSVVAVGGVPPSNDTCPKLPEQQSVASTGRSIDPPAQHPTSFQPPTLIHHHAKSPKLLSRLLTCRLHRWFSVLLRLNSRPNYLVSLLSRNADILFHSFASSLFSYSVPKCFSPASKILRLLLSIWGFTNVPSPFTRTLVWTQRKVYVPVIPSVVAIAESY